MIRAGWLLIALCALAPAWGAQVRIPPLEGARASVQLVDAATLTPMLGFDGPDWATAYAALSLDGEQIITLTPTAAIAADAATCYLVQVRADGGRSYRACVQVADAGGVQELRDLAGAAAIDPADLIVGRLIPSGGLSGYVLGKAADEDYAVTWVAPGSAGVETDPVYAASDAASVTAALIGEWSAAYGWGDHASAGYLSSYAETDPVYAASDAASVTAALIGEWSAAYGWGDHASAGYLSSYAETDPVALAAVGALTPAAIGAEPAGLVSAPSTPTSACTAGARAWASPYLYTCIATDTWVRAAPQRVW